MTGLLAVLLLAASDPRLPVLEAMAGELQRSAERLRLDGSERPYFIGYLVRDVTHHEVGDRHGAVMDDRTRRDRSVAVDVRVGSYDLDSAGGGEDVIVLGEAQPTWYAPREAPLEGDKDGQTYKGQLGRPVLPPFLSVVDDPTLASAGGTPLNGSYAFDDQGVPAQRAVLVEGGTLAGYLLSRRPVRPFERSNGHGRAQGPRPPMARMANLVVTSSRQVPREELRRLLMEEARRQGKPYGLRVRDVTGGNTSTASYGDQAFKGTPRLVYRVDSADR